MARMRPETMDTEIAHRGSACDGAYADSLFKSLFCGFVETHCTDGEELFRVECSRFDGNLQ